MNGPRFKPGDMACVELDGNKNWHISLSGLMRPIDGYYAPYVTKRVDDAADLVELFDFNTLFSDPVGECLCVTSVGIVIDAIPVQPMEQQLDAWSVNSELIDHDWFYVVAFGTKRYGFRECELRRL